MFFNDFLQKILGILEAVDINMIALVTRLATRLRHLHYHIAFDCPIDIVSYYQSEMNVEKRDRHLLKGPLKILYK